MLFRSDWYMILDSKDCFVENVDFFKDYLTHDNKAIMPVIDSPRNEIEPFMLAFRMSHLMWGLDYTKYLTHHLPNNTPFMIKTNMMKQMMIDLDLLTFKNWPYFFGFNASCGSSDSLITEFTIYSAYCQFKNNLSDYVNYSKSSLFFGK